MSHYLGSKYNKPLHSEAVYNQEFIKVPGGSPTDPRGQRELIQLLITVSLNSSLCESNPARVPLAQTRSSQSESSIRQS